VYPRATAGRLLSFKYDPAHVSFTMQATSTSPVTRGDRNDETVIYIPPLVRGTVSTSGAAVLDDVVQNPDGSRSAYVAPTGSGAYGVSIG
jgi:hypothetical protein